ncbi:uncharacterized protein LOC134261157 [Saccostrea cucullata]|uniref:uncharacterized protein LOC134261157 n=1 Tax=Saccostrea cuccullata TaxID=36930 RepID=UPI002ED0D4F7
MGGYHSFPDKVRCVLYCLLLLKNYTTKDRDYRFQKLLEKLKKKYFPHSADVTLANVSTDVIKTEAGFTTFASEDTRHEVMYTFVTECLLEDDDLEFFLTEASSDVILEYCRSWEYEKNEKERCLYVPYRPEKIINALIDKLQMNIISHCTISDENVHDSVCERLGVPREVLFWDQEARERYVDYAKRGTHTVHHARGMIVGCAGAGKTTLLKRLLRCS